jgi:hypothetical protein
MKPMMKYVLTYNMFIRAHVLEKTAGGKVEDNKMSLLAAQESIYVKGTDRGSFLSHCLFTSFRCNVYTYNVYI